MLRRWDDAHDLRLNSREDTVALSQLKPAQIIKYRDDALNTLELVVFSCAPMNTQKPFSCSL